MPAFRNKAPNVNMDGFIWQDLQHQILQPPDKNPDLFGIEVELEGKKIISHADNLMKFWALHQDGSLRAAVPGSECIEYVSRRPLNFKEVQQSLLDLIEHLTQPGVQVFPSYRTSIHVHVNCLQETTRTVMNFITLAIIFDELFVSQNGASRPGNNFCLRARDAEGQIMSLIDSIQQTDTIYNVHNNFRYSSVNTQSISKFGTIEFRSLECTTDYNRIIHWVKTIQALKVAARDFSDPQEIIAKFSRRGPFGFLTSILGEQAVKYAAVPDMQNMLRNGMRLAQDFAFCCDWKYTKPQPRKGTKVTAAVPQGLVQNVWDQLVQEQANLLPNVEPPPNWFPPEPNMIDDDDL